MRTIEEYRYRALRRDGVVEAGTIEAARPDEVSRLLGDRGLFAIEIGSVPAHPITARSVPWADLALGLRLLANLLQSGLPMDRALLVLGDSAPRSWQTILPGIAARVAQGASPGEAFAEGGGVIPPLIGGMLRAGETSGIASAVSRAASVAESVASTRAALSQALVYPAVLLGAGVLSLAFLTGVVLPRFAQMLDDIGQSLPATTRFVLASAAAARLAFVPAFAILAISLIAWSRWTATASGRLAWHQLLLEIPLIGPVRRSLATARACGVIGALLENGIPLSQALAHGADGAGDAAVSDALLRARKAIHAGATVSASLAAEGAVTMTAAQLTRTGEETGRLGAMLTEASRLEHASAERQVKRAVQLIEPAFILLFGGLVGLVAVALLQALYGIRPV